MILTNEVYTVDLITQITERTQNVEPATIYTVIINMCMHISAVLISCTEPVIQLWNRRRPKAVTDHTYSHTSKRINIFIVPTVGWGLSRDTLSS